MSCVSSLPVHPYTATRACVLCESLCLYIPIQKQELVSCVRLSACTALYSHKCLCPVWGSLPVHPYTAIRACVLCEALCLYIPIQQHEPVSCVRLSACTCLYSHKSLCPVWGSLPVHPYTATRVCVLCGALCLYIPIQRQEPVSFRGSLPVHPYTATRARVLCEALCLYILIQPQEHVSCLRLSACTSLYSKRSSFPV